MWVDEDEDRCFILIFFVEKDKWNIGTYIPYVMIFLETWKKGGFCMNIVKVVVASILTVIVKVLIADEDKE